MRDTGQLVIDGREVACPASLDIKYLRFGNLIEGKPIPCGDGYYVLGDDLKDSDDSRFNGPVPRPANHRPRVADRLAVEAGGVGTLINAEPWLGGCPTPQNGPPAS